MAVVEVGSGYEWSELLALGHYKTTGNRQSQVPGSVSLQVKSRGLEDNTLNNDKLETLACSRI